MKLAHGIAMRYYSIDTNDRFNVYFILAVISIGLSYLGTQLSEHSAYLKIAVPSSFMAYLLLISVFDKFAWKWPLLDRLVSIPVLEGYWEGTLIRETSFNEKTTRNISLIVTQRWRKMSLIFKGENSESEAVVIAMFKENAQHIRLKWIYNSRDISGKEHNNLYGEGTTDLVLDYAEGRKVLRGTYYSSKQRKGRIVLTYRGFSNDRRNQNFHPLSEA